MLCLGEGDQPWLHRRLTLLETVRSAFGPTRSTPKEVVRSSASNEFVFAVVGHVGSGTSLIAEALQEALADERLPGATFETRIIKARSVLTEWAVRNDFPLRPPDDKSMQATELLQDCGDAMRKRVVGSGQHDYAAVAKGLIKIIHNVRAAAAPKTDADDDTSCSRSVTQTQGVHS